MYITKCWADSIHKYSRNTPFKSICITFVDIEAQKLTRALGSGELENRQVFKLILKCVLKHAIGA